MASSGDGGSVFDCPICLEKLNNPKYLPCLHTFCELCIQSFIDSSISDCVINHRQISFDCPVCRRVNSPPDKNISAKEWAEHLPKNHQLLAIQDSYKEKNISERVFMCDSCIQNGEQIRARLRCKQCRKNLCKTCCKFIHKRVKAFELHTIVDINSQNPNIEITAPGNCMIHIDKPIEIYCFDHGKVGCIFCLTTKHKKCDAVLSLDEIADHDLENSSKRFIRETKQMRDLTTCTIQDTKKNITELHKKKDEILSNVSKNIENIKQRLDSLHSIFRDSLRNTHEKKTSEMTSTLKSLENFNAILAKSENIACPVMERETRKQSFITKENIKLQIYDQLENIREKRNQMKKLALTWTLVDVLNRFHSLTKLGDFEYIMEDNDFLTQIESHYNALENARVQKKKDSIRIMRGISIDHTWNTDDLKIIATAFDIRTSSWSFAFSFWVNWFDVKTKNWQTNNQSYINALPASLLLNQDKSFRARNCTCTKIIGNGLFTKQVVKFIEVTLTTPKTITQQTKLKNKTGKEIKVTDVLELSLKFLYDDFVKHLSRLETCASYIHDGKYVIIVPTHFNENMQEFIKEAAVKSGIPRSPLSVVLETEALFFYYQCLVAERAHYDVEEEVRVGKKYLVVSFGEEISTVTINQKGEKGLSNEVLKISTVPWGLQSVFDGFENFMTEIMGQEQLVMYKSKHRRDFEELAHAFLKKYSNLDNSTGRSTINMSIPFSMINYPEGGTKASLKNAISLSKYSKRVELSNSILKWNKEDFLKFGDKVTEAVLDQIKTEFAVDMAEVETILLFGSLSQSGVVQGAVRKSFDTKRVIALDSDAAAKGAVYIGHMLKNVQQ